MEGVKYAGRFIDCQQICQPVNLLAEMEGVKYAGRFIDCHQICQSVNLPSEMEGIKSAGRFSDYHQIFQQKWRGINLLADLVTLTKSANQ